MPAIYTDRPQLQRKQALRRRVYRKRAPSCPVCHGLECLCRPRYFSGQVLTESDLNAEQQYVIKKNRLHNLYLHGWGVVCGLEVFCHPSCEGQITLKQGYAISPCGDDIIVCEDTDFDVLRAIQECAREERKAQDCSPRSTVRSDCDEDGCWYLTLTYKETATRAITSLRPSASRRPSPCSCGAGNASCGCGGGGGSSCGCGGGSNCRCGSGSRVSSNGSRTAVMTPPLPACEPSRYCEGFELRLCRAPEEDDGCSLDRLMEGTLLERIQHCALEICAVVDAAPNINTDDPGRLRDDCCAYLRKVRDFFEQHPTTKRSSLDELARLRCPEFTRGPGGFEFPQPAGQLAAYRQSVGEVVARLKAMLVQAFVECLCLQLMPPCPEDPGDERIYLACVNIKDGKIDEICNFKGRKQVWTWPTALYWMSITPVVPLMSCILERLCCGDYGPRAGEALLEQFCGKDRPSYSDNVDFEPFGALSQLMGSGSAGVGGMFGLGQVFKAMGGTP